MWCDSWPFHSGYKMTRTLTRKLFRADAKRPAVTWQELEDVVNMGMWQQSLLLYLCQLWIYKGGYVGTLSKNIHNIQTCINLPKRCCKMCYGLKQNFKKKVILIVKHSSGSIQVSMETKQWFKVTKVLQRPMGLNLNPNVIFWYLIFF